MYFIVPRRGLHHSKLCWDEIARVDWANVCNPVRGNSKKEEEKVFTHLFESSAGTKYRYIFIHI